MTNLLFTAASTVKEELEKLLNREASALNRELEVERILKAFKLNPYEILDIDESIPTEQVKRRYRQLSLFIHPDKTPHKRAPEAFDLLKKAESELSDEKKRAEVDATVMQARNLLLREHKLPTNIEDTDPRLKDLSPPFRTQLRLKCKEIMIDEEVRRRKAIKMNLANEGLEAQRQEAEQLAKKRKAEADKVWEETREERVGSWRNFASGSKKKKQKTKPNVLG
ncbi:DnaJ-domain-containing protein [Fomitiporia mediterranea MF3/22]|uniref:DnaJ-domain-containing protein n=1 Tax=Fomitiporia mediterranea (strain MF3/22) TaxID=694068 RepID=UPI00044098B1|nr:DnaJ-domain-containing protein [Fomitiporia mediterranea MF3/22]EJD06455.1 DnaJ-domain-containing protein [Fomitiporia mediterranea MF3/22]